MSFVMTERELLAQRGKRLEYFTIGWNTLEGAIAVTAGAIAGSISLVGFGVDSFIEVTSGSALLWRLSMDADLHRREQVERRSLRIVGACFLGLAAYVTYEALRDHPLAALIMVPIIAKEGLDGLRGDPCCD